MNQATHAHAHSEDRASFYIEQICTLAICALLGVVVILLYEQNRLRFILADKFIKVVYELPGGLSMALYPVLWGGAALVVLVALRVLALSVASRNGTTPSAHNHNHEREHDSEHDCGHVHNHDHHDHDHHDHADCDKNNHCGEGHHEHEHEHSHAHSHAGHGHDHGLNPWRYIVLLLPIVLYFLGLPNEALTVRGGATADLEAGMSGKFAVNTGLKITKDPAKDEIQVVAVAHSSPAADAGIRVRDSILQITRLESSDGKPLAKPEVIASKGLSAEEAAKLIGGKPQTKAKLTIQHSDGGQPQEVDITRKMDVMSLEFRELEKGSYNPSIRSLYEGRVVRLKGQFSPGADKRSFSLVRLKIACCAADAIPLNVVIRLDPQAAGDMSHLKQHEWVEVTGQAEYLRKVGKDEYVAVLNVASPNDVVTTAPDPNPYIQ
jgi:hypothetical protein